MSYADRVHNSCAVRRRAVKKAGRTCKCGYLFSTDAECPKFESYELINVRYYRTFLKRETEVLKSRGRKRDAAIYRSSRLIGCVEVCPECSRLYIIWPEGEGREDAIERYRPDGIIKYEKCRTGKVPVARCKDDD
jgi:hypothetical protein